jgi:hypothetical protein
MMTTERLVWNLIQVNYDSELMMLQSSLNTKQSICDKCEININS